MKKYSIAFVALALLTTLNLHAAIVLSDSFNYPDGPITNAVGTPWIAHSGAATSPLNVTNAQLYINPNLAQDANALLSGGPYLASGNATLYSSFLVKCIGLPTAAGSYFAHFKDNNTGAATGFGARLYASTTNAIDGGLTAGGTFRFGIANGNSANPASGQIGSDLPTNITFRIVTRFVPSTGVSTIWFNPSVETDPSTTATDIGTNGRPNAIDVYAYAFRQNTGEGTFLVDDLKVGTAFADVVGSNPALNPPSISSIPDQSIPANSATAAIAFTIGDGETAAASLSLGGTSTNTTLVPNANITFGGSASNRTVTVTPANNQQGITAITVTVTDSDNNSSAKTFLVTVGAPRISTISSQSTPVNTASKPITLTVSDNETAASNLTISATSSNQAIVPDGGIVTGGSGTNRTLVVTPAAGQFGTVTITVSVSDGSFTIPTTFFLTVTQPFGVVLNEPFVYGDGVLTNLTSDWVTHSGTSGETVTGQNLQVSESLSADINHVLSGAPYAPANGYLVYASLNVNFTQLPSTPDGSYFAHLKDSTTSNFRARLFATTANAAPGSFRLGVANNGATASAQYPLDLALNKTYTVVVRYNVDTGLSTLWVNPLSETSSSVTAADGPSTLSVSGFAFRQNLGIGVLWADDVRVAGTFADVLNPLTIDRSGGALQISWTVNAVNFVLQSSSDVGGPWQNVSDVPSVVGGKNVVQVPAPVGRTFYRLFKP